MLDVQTQLMSTTGILIVALVAWLFCALTAFSSWRAFKVRADLLWTFAFLVLALASGGRAFEAYRWVSSIDLLAQNMVDVLASSTSAGLRYAAFEMVGALLAVFAFRARRVTFE